MLVTDIRQAVRKSQLTQRQVAALANVHEVTLSRWLCGKVDVRGETLSRIAKAVGVEVVRQ